MIDTLTSANHTDFVARYRKTIGYHISDTGVKTLVFVKNVTDRCVEFEDVNKFTFYGNIDKGVMFEFIPVNKGFFNGFDQEGNMFLYKMCRVPARQWSRGISQSNTSLEKYVGRWLNKLTYFDELANVFGNGISEQAATRRAYNLYMEGKIQSFALSRHFAVIGAAFVFFHDHMIGTITKPNSNHLPTIALNSDVVKQELTDVIRRKGFEIEVLA